MTNVIEVSNIEHKDFENSLAQNLKDYWHLERNRLEKHTVCVSRVI